MSAVAAQEPLRPAIPVPPHGDDYTALGLFNYSQQLLAHFGVGYHDLPLDIKAEYFEWELWRYHRTPYHQVYNRSRLPDQRGQPPVWLPGSDSSTWNGALLAALSYKYAVTRDAQTLARICELLQGLHFFLAVTGQRGLPARNVTPAGGPVQPDQQPYVAPDGRRYVFRSEAAKGTMNQLVGGYAVLLMHVGDALPAEIGRLAREDLAAMVVHLVDHDYHLTERDGKRTPYGDLTPLVATIGVPFNAQVAYLIVAAGHYYPPENADERGRVEAQFELLRHKHHVYYEEPWGSLVVPQRIGGSPFVKGMNDRMHVTTAAFLGLMLEIHDARRRGQPPDRKLMYQLGRTLLLSRDVLQGQHNSLCDFMWMALVQDPQVYEAIVTRKRNTVHGQADRGLADGVEQLRRFRLERFVTPGREVPVGQVVYNDAYCPDDYHWKVNPDRIWQATGAPTSTVCCAIDYLHAYWLFRFYQLDRYPTLATQNLPVLRNSPDLPLFFPPEQPPQM